MAAAGFIAAGPVALADTPQQQAADGPVVVDGVATYRSDTTIGRLSVPSSWKKIVIGENITLRGNFLIPDNRTSALTIQGENDRTSQLVGHGSHVKDTDYAAVSTDARIDLTLKTFTSLNPRISTSSPRGPRCRPPASASSTTGTSTTTTPTASAAATAR
ncbi:hypothetical protein ACIQXA_04730 [Streptomyces massasporeus]|uniref:hypothetical protein n=1 Tax=Streptomyces massasporeus TaxID=67324 RepID=UPI0037F38B0F